MAQVILKLYKSSPTPWNKEVRKSLMEVSKDIISLSWGYRPSSGGLWGGKASFLLTKGTPAYEELVTGVSGTYEIQWIPTLPADRTIDNYDDYKTNFLLSFGTTENVNIDLDSLVCSMDLKGAAQHFHKVLVNLEATSEFKTVSDLVGDVYTASITNNGLIRTQDVSTLGSSQRSFMFDEPESQLGVLMKNLQTRAGGENLWGWGIRPTSSLTAGLEELGEAYFQPYTGPDELADGNKKTSWFLSANKVISSKVRRRDSDIKNVIIVRSDKTGLAPGVEPFEGQARNEYSIARFGERELVVFDSSIQNEKSADDLAAVICESKSNPRDEIEIVASVELDGGNQDASVEGKFSGLVQTGLRNGASTILIEKGTNPAIQGDSLGCNFSGGSSSDAASCLKVDTSNQPAGPRAAYPALKTADNLASGEEITYVIQGQQTSGSRPAADIAVLELDRQLSFGWEYVSGNNYKLAAKYFNSSSAWVTGSLSSVLIPWSVLSAEHTVYITAQFSSTSGVSNVVVNIANDSLTTTELIDVALPSSILKTGINNDLILVNAWEGTGSGGVANPDESRDFELSGFSAYVSNASANYGNVNLADLMEGTKNQTPPITYAPFRVIDTKLGVVNDSDATKCLVRFRPATGYVNLIADGSFEGLPILHSNMFGGQTQSILALDQQARNVNGEVYATFTYPNGHEYVNSEISTQRSRFEAKRAYCATYDVLEYTSGKIELGVKGDDEVELKTAIGNNKRTEFELDLTGGTPGLYIPQVGNLTKSATSKWTISNLRLRSIGGGTLVTGSTKENASWENWSVTGDGSDGGTQRGQTQIGWKDGSDGKTSARILVGAGTGLIVFFYQAGIVDNWRRYRATFKAKSPHTGVVVGVMGADAAGSSTDLVTETPSLTSDWETYSIEFWGNDNGQFAIGTWNAVNASKNLKIDEVSVQEIPSPGEIKSGYLASIQKESGNSSAFGSNTIGVNYSDSLIGSGDKSHTVGGAIEIIPRNVEVTYQSENSPLLVKIKASVQGDAVTSDIESIHEKIEALDNTLRGDG